MKEYRAEAKTIEAAIAEGLEELGLERDQISYTVEQEPKAGFLGLGAKKAIVIVREKEQYRRGNRTGGRFHKKSEYRGGRKDYRKGSRRRNDAYASEYDYPRRADYSRRDSYSHGSYSDKGSYATTNETSDNDYSHRTSRYGYEDARIPRTEYSREKTDRPQKERRPHRFVRRERVYDVEPMAEEFLSIPFIEDPAEHAKEVLTRLLQLMGVENPIVNESRLEEKGALVYISFSCGDPYEFTRENGRMLQAMQFMLNTIINKKREPHLALRLDTDGYWERKKEEIAVAVERAVGSVKANGNVYRLDPMPATMRKLVHTLVLEKYPDMKTASEGEGRWRKVVVMPKTEEEIQQGTTVPVEEPEDDVICDNEEQDESFIEDTSVIPESSENVLNEAQPEEGAEEPESENPSEQQEENIPAEEEEHSATETEDNSPEDKA